MSRQLSVARILGELEERIEHHRRQEAHHAAQVALHQEQQARHAADLAVARERHATFLAAADAAGELVARPREERKVEGAMPEGKWAVLSTLIARLIVAKGPLESFGAKGIAAEIEERWGDRLQRPVDPRTVAAKLRRLAQRGLIHRLRTGRAYHESLFSQTPPPAES